MSRASSGYAKFNLTIVKELILHKNSFFPLNQNHLNISSISSKDFPLVSGTNAKITVTAVMAISPKAM